MGRQNGEAQNKRTDKIPGKEQNEMKASKLSDKKSKTMVIIMLKELSGNFNSIKKRHETIKKNQ